MKGKRGIVTVGERRHEWPRELWGWLDWRREEAAQHHIKTLGKPPPVVPDRLLPPGFGGLYAKPRRGGGRRDVDRLLDRLGLRKS